MDYINLLRTVFDAYLTKLNSGGIEPSASYLLRYDFEEAIDARHWRLDDGLIEVNGRGLINNMVKSELRDLTNDLNQWHQSLQRWNAWNKVLAPYNTDEVKTWHLLREFLVPLAFYCLFQPSASRDRFTFVVTNAMHQVRLMIEKGYQDYLKTPNEKPQYPTRQEKEKRLSKLISIWPEEKEFMKLLRTIDDYVYKKETSSDYRNLHSHSIGPQLGLGHVQFVVRSVSEHTEMIKQSDGTYRETPTGKMVAGYGFGGTPPLDLEKARLANLEQYHRARRCYESYRKLLAAGLEKMPLAR